MTWTELLPVLIPLLLINVAFQVFAIIDVHKHDREVVFFSKTAWTVILVIVNVAWVVYLLGGRKE